MEYGWCVSMEGAAASVINGSFFVCVLAREEMDRTGTRRPGQHAGLDKAKD